jgi:hypothetical protein
MRGLELNWIAARNASITWGDATVTDLDLLLFGCVVSFVCVAGAYIYLGHRYSQHDGKSDEVREERPSKSSPRRAA